MFPRAHHLVPDSLDPKVSILDNMEHISLCVDTCRDDSDCASLSSGTGIYIGIFTEIAGSDGSYLDTDSECEFYEEYKTYVKVITSVYSSFSLSESDDEQILKSDNKMIEPNMLRSFSIFVMALSYAELSPWRHFNISTDKTN